MLIFVLYQLYAYLLWLFIVCIIAVALLCQLRSLRPDGNASKLDQLPSFRFYKKRIILNTAGPALTLSLAASLPEAVTLLPDYEAALEQ